MASRRTIPIVFALLFAACAGDDAAEVPSSGDVTVATDDGPESDTAPFGSATKPADTTESVQEPTLQIGLVAPSAVDDLAWTESMVGALERVAEQRNIDVDMTVGVDVVEDADAAISNYADAGVDLVIAHGSQYGGLVEAVAAEHPDVLFAIGSSTDFFGADNVFAYTIEAAEGGYVNGIVAAQLSASRVVGVVGPVAVGDAERYVSGFVAGVAAAAPDVQVLVNYIDSFSDVQLASEAAAAMLGAGADVLSGTAQMSVGAAQVAIGAGVPWLGSQSDQTALGVDAVVMSAVYHWDEIVTEILDAVADGSGGGQALTTSMVDGGLTVEFNDAFPLTPGIRASADAAIADIVAGEVDLPVPG